MLKIVYFLLLGAASVEDYKFHTVRPGWTIAVVLLGFAECITKENRWVTLALTCACFCMLLLFYRLVLVFGSRYQLQFGGADVRLIPGMMLMQGWDVALGGVFVGLLLAAIHYALSYRKRKELPLVPWMTGGCMAIELLLYF